MSAGTPAETFPIQWRSPGLAAVGILLLFAALQAGQQIGKTLRGSPHNGRQLALARASSGGALPIVQAVATAISGAALSEEERQQEIGDKEEAAERIRLEIRQTEASFTELTEAIKRLDQEAATAERDAKRGPQERMQKLEAELRGLTELHGRIKEVQQARAAAKRAAVATGELPGSNLPTTVAEWESKTRAEWQKLVSVSNAADKVAAFLKLKQEIAAKAPVWENGSFGPTEREEATKVKDDLESKFKSAESAVEAAKMDLVKAAQESISQLGELRRQLETANKKLGGKTT